MSISMKAQRFLKTGNNKPTQEKKNKKKREEPPSLRDNAIFVMYFGELSVNAKCISRDAKQIVSPACTYLNPLISIYGPRN